MPTSPSVDGRLTEEGKTFSIDGKLVLVKQSLYFTSRSAELGLTAKQFHGITTMEYDNGTSQLKFTDGGHRMVFTFNQANTFVDDVQAILDVVGRRSHTNELLERLVHGTARIVDILESMTAHANSTSVGIATDVKIAREWSNKALGLLPPTTNPPPGVANPTQEEGVHPPRERRYNLRRRTFCTRQ